MTRVRNAVFILLCVLVLGTARASARTDYCGGAWGPDGSWLVDIYCDENWFDGYWPDHTCEDVEEEFLDMCTVGVAYFDCEIMTPGYPALPTADFVFRCLQTK